MKHPKGVIDLTEAEVELANDAEIKKKLCFVIKTKSRNYFIQGKSEEEVLHQHQLTASRLKHG